jgi:Protein of unknown function (DUF1326)
VRGNKGTITEGLTSPAGAVLVYLNATPRREGTLVWHIREGRYGEVMLDGLNVLGLGAFTGNIWSGRVKTVLGVFFDQRAGQAQRQALQMIFTGQVNTWPRPRPGTFEAGGHPGHKPGRKQAVARP